MNIPIIRIPYDEDDIKYIKDEIEKVLRSGYLTMSRKVKEFEEKYAKYCGTKYAIGTNSGTSSLEMILRAIEVDGYNVIVPSNTYMATPIAVVKAGGKVIFTECTKENLQIDPDDIERKIRFDTKAVIVVHIGGFITPHFKRIKDICKKNNLVIVEDAAHAHGASIDGKMAGSLGLAGSFSFYPTKVLTTAEGGMITTDNDEIFKKSIVLREHGKADHNLNIHTEFGDNWRFSEIHAVLGLQQMKKVNWILNERRRIAAQYDLLLKDIDEIRPIKIDENIKPSYYKYIAYLDERIERNILKDSLKINYNIFLPGEVYSNPCHSQPVFKKYPEKMLNSEKDEFPVTDYVCKHHICLPLYPSLNDDEIMYVIKSLKECIKKGSR